MQSWIFSIITPVFIYLCIITLYYVIFVQYFIIYITIFTILVTFNNLLYILDYIAIPNRVTGFIYLKTIFYIQVYS